jgi:hypothetical protein
MKLEWSKNQNKWFANFGNWLLCICEPVKKGDTEFTGYVRYYGSVTSTGIEETKKEIFNHLKNLGAELTNEP